jgi:pyruvate-formate lyase-activating enzyme
MSEPMPMSIDIEMTNRCNAKCTFCPRESTPHQGMMTAETFDKALERCVEYLAVARDAFAERPFDLTFCGMGEPLLHPRLPDSVGRVVDAGFRCNMASNGSLLDEDTARALIDNGLNSIYINLGEHGDDYEATYHMPYERTLDNVVRFNELSNGRCEVIAVVVDHRGDPEHVDRMVEYWSSHGISHTRTLEAGNRGGSLYVDHMQFQALPEVGQAWLSLQRAAGTPMCSVPFHCLFIGYDGSYCLCANDWERRAQMGGVFDRSFEDVIQPKIDFVSSRNPVCATCNIDPTNVLATALHQQAEGRLSVAETNRERSAQHMRVAIAHEWVERLGFEVPNATPPGRPLIPVSEMS